MTESNDERVGGVRRKFSMMAFMCWLLPLLGLYLDDLLIVAAGICFVSASAIAFGLAPALAVAGLCLLGYSFVVARSRERGDDR